MNKYTKIKEGHLGWEGALLQSGNALFLDPVGGYKYLYFIQLSHVS